jgi:EAL domain-containing protein (putative c-di-GMP-specific phosphodiesterase class I)
MVAPDQFIPMAEDSGLIMPIGRWVLQAAALHSRKLNRGGTPLYVSVNLSARQFRDPTLVQSVRETLLSSRADGAQMQIEITETAVMSDAEEAVQTLRDLKDLGLRISVDDFGTGYSSLSYLKRFPLDTLKIDRGFVRDLATDPDDLTISRTVIDLAHGLGLGVIAEGVETARQAEILAGHGCDAAQGFLYGRPAPAH